MAKPKSRKKKAPKRVLALPDLEHAKTAVLNSLTSASGQRTYDHAIREFVAWYCSEPRLAFNRTVVLRYRIHLEQRGYAPATINLRLAAVRRIANEAADARSLEPRIASPVANQMTLAPALGPIGRIRTSLVTAMHRADGTTVHDRSRPINLIVSTEPIQQREVNDPKRSLVANRAGGANTSSPTAPEFLREHLPGNAAGEDKQNAGETRAIRDARPPAFRPTRWSWQERFNKIPQRIGKQCRGHTRSHYFADEDHVFGGFLHALSSRWRNYLAT